MTGKRFFHFIILMMIAIPMLVGSTGLVVAKDPPPPSGPDQPKKDRITPADRKAAAERAAEAGFEVMEMGTAEMQMPGDAPHYFSVANYANSPLRMADAVIELVGGDGTGALAESTVDLITGEITAINITNPGSGYTVAPSVVIMTQFITTPTRPAEAVALLSSVIPAGSIENLVLLNGGSGYSDPVTVEITGGAGTGATAAAEVQTTGPVSSVTITNPGQGYSWANVGFNGLGTGAAADAVLAPAGVINSITVTDSGAGYTTASVSIIGDGSGAVAEAVIGGNKKISAINVINGGSGYTSATVVITGDGTKTALATANITVGGEITAIHVTSGGAGYTAATTVTIDGDGTSASASAVVDISGAITSLTLLNGGQDYSEPVTVNFISATGSGAQASASVSTGSSGAPGEVASVQIIDGGAGYVTPGIRKFVNELAGLGKGNANDLGQYIPLAKADVTSYPGSDYYEIAVVEYEEKMHSDLPPTRLRGYVQLETADNAGDSEHYALPGGFVGFSKPHYLGPTIIATKDRPVRILFRNLLPAGMAGNLFIPVDTTVMGSGMGPMMPSMDMSDPQNPYCDAMPKPMECYTENRAVLHLHGGISPWISDGTPHQWITPQDEMTPYKQGVSVTNVPDMPDPGPGAQTYYYTNQQSARLMFYHDHSWGITRLNVYAGEAAGYIITDETEAALVQNGIIPSDMIPLIVQDKTFVPAEWQLAATDPLWDMNRWGDMGDLWLPHVYSPAQNPGDASGVNQFGRWAYGPWFWPPTTVDHGPMTNPYYDPTCDPDMMGWCEPALMPGVPFNSMGMEAFHDTPIINGTVYPTLTLEPKSYRFRILNAASDRFFNLSLYKADGTGTEVALNAAEVEAALTDPAAFPTPNTSISPPGPSWVQIGTEGGFLPAPTVIPAQPITWVADPTVFNAGNVDLHSLLLGPAERADVIVDFSQFAGQTLILYNDAPAAFPARDPRYDYYTGSADLTDTGGVPPVMAGFGPNTRTMMQIKILDNPPAPAFNLNALDSAFKSESLGGMGVFEKSQHPIIVGQSDYNSAYGTSFKNGDGLVQIFNTSLTFNTLENLTLTMPLGPKQIQDEMGEAFEAAYGRMSGNLGVETPNAQAGLQNMILYAYAHPPTEVLDGIELPEGVELTPIASTDDGSQIWKITHNGVDTHPIHFHLFDVQLINRVGWDGIIRKPDANELGWKDTVRISPLEDTIVALRPLIPHVPFDLPNSVRLLDPSMPEGAVIASATQAEAEGKAMMSFAPNGEPIDIINHYINFGWEYVWHCHILSHEEMDMMRPIVVGVAPKAPSELTISVQGASAILTWLDNSINETSIIIQRANDRAFLTGLTVFSLPPDTTSYIDSTIKNNTTYYYRVFAQNLIGDTWDYSDPNLNEGAFFPTKKIDSDFSNLVMIGVEPTAPAAPTNLAATVQVGPQVSLAWRDNANNETGFMIERAVEGGLFTPLATAGANAVSYVDTTVMPSTTYAYRVKAVNAGGESVYSNLATATIPGLPAAPSMLTGTAFRQGGNAKVTLSWMDNANNETGFIIQRATNLNFTTGITNTNVGANTTTYTTGNISRNTTYYFRVRSYNATGGSAWSNIFIITTP